MTSDQSFPNRQPESLMTVKSTPTILSLKVTLMAGLATTMLFAGVPDAAAVGYAVQPINSPGPTIRMSGNGAVTGYFVAKCSTINGYERFTYCYNAPWLFDGKSVNKLTNKFGSTANAQAVAVNDSLELVGADVNGAWFYSAGTVTRPGGTNTRLFAVNNNHVAVGMSSVSGVYQPVTYQNNVGLVPALLSGTGKTAVDINDAGMIAGWYTNSSNIQQSFVADANGVVTDIPNLLDAASGTAINCRPVRISQVNATTGQVWVAGNCAGNRPFLYELSSGTLTELNFPGSSNLSVVSVNSQGMAVGTAVKPGAFAPDGYTAIFWPAGSTPSTIPTDLNANQAFAPVSINGVAWNVHSADINEAGTILTGYNDTSGNFYTFELHPIP